MGSRIYVVSTKEAPDEKYLIRANSQSQAVGFVLDRRYTTRVAKQDDLVDLMGLGVKVEDATEA